MELKKIKLSELKPLKENVRRHSENQINELIRSVKQFGQTRAIVVDEDNNILIGNGLYYALEKMEAPEAECFVKTGLTETQKKKLILTDNKVFALGSDDYNEIQNYINDITSTGDFDIAGFDTYTLEMMTMSDDENEEDMKDYGKITDDTLIKGEPDPTPQRPSGTSTEEQVNYPAEGSGEQSTVSDPTTVEQKVERKSIICPSCGEVIYLD